jgi:hypothetical protein
MDLNCEMHRETGIQIAESEIEITILSIDGKSSVTIFTFDAYSMTV